jgi:hypothetical protein
MRRRHEPAWKQTSPIDRHPEKQKADKTRICDGMSSEKAAPKYRTNE